MLYHLLFLHLNLNIYHCSSRSGMKFLSPVTYPATPANDLNSNGDLNPLVQALNLNNLSIDDPDHDNHNQLSPDNLQSSSKDG